MNKMTTMKKDFDNFLETTIKLYFKEKSTLNSSIIYSLNAPGKRIRPLLVLAFSEMFKGKKEAALCSALAIEMIHTYSLIHDDLPSMDNDDFRRGLPTNHKVYGEAQAILAGDSLLNLAPEYLIKELQKTNFDPSLTLELVSKMLEASGHLGMIKGQSLDIEFESKEINFLDSKNLAIELKNIHHLKTGAIITWSALAGLYSSEDKDLIRKFSCPVESIGQRIGLLFQVVDDIIDVTSTLDQIGKTPGKDLAAGKLTYTSLYRLDGAKEMAKELFLDIKASLEELQNQGFETNLVEEILTTICQKISNS